LPTAGAYGPSYRAHGAAALATPTMMMWSAIGVVTEGAAVPCTC
jgi:hypothetical protein